MGVTNAIIVHGWGGDSRSHWIPWLRKQLEEAGIKTTVPDFPGPDEPKLEPWMDVLLAQPIDEGTLLVGHSMGCPLIFRFLEQIDIVVARATFVAPFATDLDREPHKSSGVFDELFDWRRMREHAAKIDILISLEDPYIDPGHAKQIASDLGVEPVIFEKGKRHFSSPFTDFPELKDLLLG